MIRESTEKEMLNAEQNLVKYQSEEKLKKEIIEIENWFAEYDKVCNEHLRCQRLEMKCHHNIMEWDNMAVEKAKRLNELRKKI